jgi:uncharacterized protein YgiM (DUF1202 family)
MCEPRRKVRIRLEHTVEYSDPIEIASGEKVSVIREDDEYPGWKWCKAPNGREGWIPIELLSNEGTEAIILQAYSARELAVLPGQEVTVEDARHSWLLVRNAQGERGWIPERNTEPVGE